MLYVGMRRVQTCIGALEKWSQYLLYFSLPVELKGDKTYIIDLGPKGVFTAKPFIYNGNTVRLDKSLKEHLDYNDKLGSTTIWELIEIKKPEDVIGGHVVEFR